MAMELNDDFKKLYRLVEHTASNVFLTGKAGTGKTTFLKYLRENSHKRMVVAAPTGVAAINAGGVTLHSLFQLPFEPFVPNRPYKEGFRFNQEKLNIIRSLDLLVIDEISMVRADVLDAVDQSLRFIRKIQAPFGGLQLLLIGDMQQLPPVVQPQEERILKEFYPSSYFFYSLALRQAGYRSVELKKVYRQTDGAFVSLLNAVRTNSLNAEQLQQLNSHYQPGFVAPDGEGFIYLTTHNNKARVVNEEKLEGLAAETKFFDATVDGTFPESNFPTDKRIALKVGAQVMFTKNDPDKRFFNGKIGTVVQMDADDDGEHIYVKFPDGVTVDTPRMRWDNVQYELNAETKEVEEKVVGSFDQYPLRLAWAITIHKSQGLTFDKVMLDANSAFAHGQVYVALSRCRTLEGLVLTSPISLNSIMTDSLIQDFSSQVQSQTLSLEQIQQLEDDYFEKLLVEQFDFSQLNGCLLSLNRVFADLGHAYDNVSMFIYKTQQQFQEEVVNVALKFRTQLETLARAKSDQLQERITKAGDYFLQEFEKLLKEVPNRLRIEISRKDLKTRYKGLCSDFDIYYKVKRATLSQAAQKFTVNDYLKTRALANIDDAAAAKTDNRQQGRSKNRPGKEAKPKQKKVPTAQQTFELFQSGKTVEEIAKLRELTTGTICGHLCTYIASGQLDVCQLVPAESVKELSAYLLKYPEDSFTQVRDGLDGKYTYDEIKMVYSSLDPRDK